MDYKEKIISILNSQELSKEQKEKLEDIFPELTESEDERIRKWIIGLLSTYEHDRDLRNAAIAWLEKQGEKKDILEDTILDSNEDGLIAETIKVGKAKKSQRIVSAEAKEAMYDKPAPVRTGPIGFDGEPMESKPCEQKPDEWEPQTDDTFRKKGTTSPTYHLCNKREDGITFGFVENREVGIAGGEITIFALKDDYELVERPKSIEDVVEEELNRALQTKGEQKSSWSKEDEKKLLCICAWIKDYPRIADFKDEMYTVANNYIDWLKSIKDRVQPQPMQWWSKDDEEMLDMCIDAATSTEHYSTSDIDSMESWLKSLKPNHWKPSDEQINICKEVYADILSAKGFDLGTVNSELNRLEEKLKKLKDEK